MGGERVSDSQKKRLVVKLGHTVGTPSSSRHPGREPRRGLAGMVRRQSVKSDCAGGRDWAE